MNFTPLHLAAMEGHIEIVKFLTVEKNCDPISETIKEITVLHGAALRGHLEIVKFLIEELKCPPDITGYLNIIPLQMAIELQITLTLPNIYRNTV